MQNTLQIRTKNWFRFWAECFLLVAIVHLLFQPIYFGYLASPDSEFYMGYVQFPQELYSRLGNHLANSPYSNYFWSRIPVIGPSFLFNATFGIETGYVVQRVFMLTLVVASSRHLLQKYTTNLRSIIISILVVSNSVLLTTLGMEYPTGIGFVVSLVIVFLMMANLADRISMNWRSYSIGSGLCTIFWAHTAFVLFWLPVLLVFGYYLYKNLKLKSASISVIVTGVGFFGTALMFWFASQALYGKSNPISNILLTSRELNYVFSQFAPGWSDSFPLWNGSISMLALLASAVIGVWLWFSRDNSVATLAKFGNLSLITSVSFLLLLTKVMDLVFLRNWLQYSLLWSLGIPLASLGVALVLRKVETKIFVISISISILLMVIAGFAPDKNSNWQVFPQGIVISIALLVSIVVIAIVLRLAKFSSYKFDTPIVFLVCAVVTIPYMQLMQNTQQEYIPSGAPAAIWNDTETSSIMDYGDALSGTNQNPKAYTNATEIDSWVLSRLPEGESFSIYLGPGTDLQSNIAARMLLYPTNGINLNDVNDIQRFTELGYLNSVLFINNPDEKVILLSNYQNHFIEKGIVVNDTCKNFADDSSQFFTSVCVLVTEVAPA